MSVVTKKSKTKVSKKHYIPHQIRSRPFYWIYFPLVTILTTMFFWLVLCPLIFARCLTLAFEDTLWPVYFWVTAFVVYLVLLALLVCCWRCSPRSRRTEGYVVTVEGRDEIDDDSCIELKEMPPKEKVDINANDGVIIDTPRRDELFPRCSVRQKKRPDSLLLTETRPVSQNLSSPLTPRELFFIDLIEGANQTCSSTTHTFLENEKQHYTPDGPLDKCSDEDQAGCGSPSEFFIANVPVEQTCTTQVFLYVDEGDKPQSQIQLEFNNEPECLACSNIETNNGQTVDSIRHLYLGRTPRMVKQCVRCGGSAGTVPVTRTAAIRAWDQRWLRSCQCGGLWRMQIYS